MKYKLYQIVSVALLLIVSAVSAFALENSAIENYRSTVVRSNDGKVQKYSVLVASVGNPKNNSDFSEHFVHRVDEKYYQKGQIYIKTKKKTDKGEGELLQAAGALKVALQSIGSTKITAFADAKRVAKNPGMQKYGLDRIYTVNIPLDRDPFEVCAELMSNPDVEYACPVSVHYRNSVEPNDPNVMQQYTLHNMEVFKAWQFSKGSPNIKIAIMDSGVDYNHPDLSENIWTNPNDGHDGIDNDGNGKIDDVHGWDFVANTDENSIYEGKYIEDNDPINLVNTHGTMVSGCAGAVTNNSEGIAGVAYNCKIIPIKLESDLEGVTGIFRATTGIIYAIELGADIINCSFGGRGYSPTEQDIINYAVLEKNIVIVAAAGNEETNVDDEPHYPSSYDNVLSVGATDEANEMTKFSNYGYSVTTFAPGARVLTTDAGGTYEEVNGTSFSSPNVSGLVALVKAVHPDWTAKQICHQIRSTSNRKKINGKSYEFFGVANALKAVTWNSPNSEKTVPGLAITNFYRDSDTSHKAITEYVGRRFRFRIKNYLPSSEKVKVQAFSPEGIVDVIVRDESYNTYELNEEREIDVFLKLKSNNPWSEGYAKIVFEFTDESGNYSDCQMIKVPIKVEGDKAISSIKFRNWYDSYDAVATSLNESFSTIMTRDDMAYLYQVNAENKEEKYQYIADWMVPRAIGKSSTKDFFIGCHNRQKRAIIKSIDGGENFKEVDVTDLVRYVNKIHFKDKMNGVFFGFLEDLKHTMVTTTDGGETWQTNPNFPTDKIDFVSKNAYLFEGDKILIGDYKGRIFATSDFGEHWREKTPVNGAVYNIAYLGAATYMVIHHSNGDAIFSLTQNDGLTWDEVYRMELKEYGPRPVSLYADKIGDFFVLLNSDGSVCYSEDLGKTWNPIRKDRTGIVNRSSIYADDEGNVAIFLYGGIVERILYKSKDLNRAKPKLAFRQGKEIDLGKVEIGSENNIKLTLVNVGTRRAKNYHYDWKQIKGEPGEFSFTYSTQTHFTFNPGDSAEAEVEFIPKSEGEKIFEVVAYYDNDSMAVCRIKAVAEGKGTLSWGYLKGVDFGNIDLNTKKELTIRIDNHSDFDVNVQGVNITPYDNSNEAPILRGNKKPTIKKKSSRNFTFYFIPKTMGVKGGMIEIVNDGKISPLKISYVARAYRDASVEESNIFANAKIIPNPAANSCQLFLGDDASKVETMEIYSQDGRLMMQIAPNFNDGSTTINTSSLPVGQYNIMLSGKGIRETVKLIVVR